MICDPFAAMTAACIAIANGDANEIELHWNESVGEVDSTLTITVRREVRHFGYAPPDAS